MSDQLPQSDPPEDQRLADCLSALSRLKVPDELAQRVRLELSSSLPIAGLLRGLQAPRVPQVLERLVREDLANPAAPLVRMVSSLPRLAAPLALSNFERGTSRLLRAPVLASLAAGVVLFFGLSLYFLGEFARRNGDSAHLRQLASNQSPRPVLRFELEPLSPSAIDPLAGQLMLALDQGRSLLGGGR